MSRKHKTGTEENLVESVVNPGVSHESEQDQSDMQIDPPSDAGDEQAIYPEIADESQFFKNVALFYLKLQAKCLLPSSVIQTIIEDFQEIHDISQSHLLFKLKERLITLGISEADTNNVIEVMKNEDLFRTCNTQPLKTNQKRKTVFKNSFNYVEPAQICLGQNEAGKECFAQMMANLSEEIKEIICKTLPNLSEETQLQIILKLQSSGLESKEDLEYVQQEDIADLLPVIQRRKLLDAFKLVTLDLQAIPTSSSLSSDLSASESSLSSCTHSSSSQLSAIASCSNRARNSEPSNRPSTFQILKTWPETFQVPWEQMPQEIRSAIADGKRPKPVARRQMVRVLADEMRRYEANPTRAQCLTVVQNIIRQYPKSFADMTPDGSLLGGGYTSLLIQVKNRIENLNRDVSFTRHRSSTQKRGPTDTYGCTRFQPEFPAEETDDTVEQHRQRLVEIYRQEGAGGAERAEVKNLMELTFSLQRRHINTLPTPDIEDVKSKWPFLFTPRYIYAHFELLTDINVLRSLELSMEECGRAITRYFRENPTNKDVNDVISYGEDNEVALRVVQLLMAHFGEDLNGLIILADFQVQQGKSQLEVGGSPLRAV
ncbi:hypothetical protein PFLUV_G00052250 [Scomber scombrus]|uniref:Uncharacterized protein n=1 Tax=Scomber scombrus TaxID=13677 RepID=A0AAV1PU55_SCOSC